MESALPDLDGLCLDDLDDLPASVLASALRRLMHESEEPSEAVVASFDSAVEPAFAEIWVQADADDGDDEPRSDGSAGVRS
ncbi:FxSxx-COOH cyclophane-containing RiPP peptide [Embleya sp. NBC_00896]|uniref:FxSxx-COOH cyclophane-containing RiPP peptide n=1 Tax=Embleya sp. NBC_00896 TaxID=2975961 RepID=UPI0038649C3E|nr:FxSxx-COOH protein [Embleya sp. NBC_00896]